MANDESNGGQSQEQLPDLYKLLGLAPLESDLTKIQRALLDMQRKADATQKTDGKLAQRATKIVALGKKNLLDPDRKSSYDRAWSKAFATARVAEPNAEPVVEPKEPELEWDLEELEAYLPAEDPRRAFDLGGFLRYSASLPESNPIADYDKLQSFLGGTATATIAAPESISATALMPEYDPQHDGRSSDLIEPIIVTKPSSSLRVPAGDFAKQIRKKRNRATLLSVAGVVGSIVLVAGAYFFWANSTKSSAKQSDQLAQATKPAPKPKTKEPTAPAEPIIPQGSGLPKVAGLDGSSPTPNMAASMMPNTAEKPAENPPAAKQPAIPMPTEPATTPAPTPTEPTPPVPTTPTPSEARPEPTPVPAVDPVLTDGEKSKWSKGMKELLKTLGNQDFATAKKQLTELETLARTRLQKDQHKRISTLVRLTEEYHGFLIDAINGLGAAEIIDIGSTKVSFVEGNEMAISLKIQGRNQTFKLTELKVGIANAIVDMKMDMAHPTSLARKAAFALVHPKTNDVALSQARKQMAEAAGAGAVEADMIEVFDEDYSLKKQIN